MPVNFHEQLRRQINFLINSCHFFDEGYKPEAIRIAQCLRVMFHTRTTNISILSHLNSTNIKIISTVKPDIVNEKMIMFDGLLAFFNKPAHSIEDVSTYEMTFSEWWNQIVFINNDVKITREKLVKSAADTDGGAHVDSKLDSDYEKIIYDFWRNSSGAITDRHLTGLRQLAFEVINSTQLIELANNG